MNAVALAAGIGCLLLPGDPPLSDLQFFPSAKIVRSNWTFARQHINWVRCQRALTANVSAFDSQNWAAWEREAFWCEHAWDKLDDACLTHLSLSCRREALRRLRDWIGEPAYYSGAMPAAVPLWRFERR